MESLKNFQTTSSKHIGNKTIFTGTINGKNAILEVIQPILNIESLDSYINLPYEPKMENSVYQIGEVSIKQEFKYNLTILEDDALLTSKDKEYCRESYNDYLERVKALSSDCSENIQNENCTGNNLIQNVLKRMQSKNDTYKIEAEYPTGFLASFDDKFGNICAFFVINGENCYTIRDISSVELLRNVKEELINFFTKNGVIKSDVCLYLDYSIDLLKPVVFASNLNSGVATINMKSWLVLLDQAIMNLSIDPEYYKKDCFYIK